ncbi:SCO family protein [Novosphingobium sp.]|uniref:SCO family protein n=1 Tax=Novosphingobium sp. TaxID=1874826 RepID=UPI0025ED10B8|nr:SCO family protein [Novosphingobium sp.]
MTKPWTFVILPALAVLGACGPSQPAVQELQGTDITGTPIGGTFTLVDANSKTVRWSDFAGRWRIVYFGYTFCPDACPMDVGVLMQGFNRFAKEHPDRAAKVQPIFISIDPARDTPAKVGEFAAAFSPRLLGLTGTQDQVDEAIRNFKALALKGKVLPGGYLMDHSRAAYLFDPQGQPIETLPIDKNAESVAADLAIAVK